MGPGYALLLAKLAEDTKSGLVISVPSVPRVQRVPGNVTARQFCPNHEDTCKEDQTCCPLLSEPRRGVLRGQAALLPAQGGRKGSFRTH